ncbi:MAG: nucleotidyltransferase domain-containing protein [Candidatus Aenigmarchaeota archaeon]|nr:nucleotidyltransferase domain-containing protein [Candidatus Aenigmarchaeota archaeon]
MSQKNNRRKILFFRESSFKVAELIFNYPNKIFHIRKLAKETGLSTTAVISATEELEEFEIVKVEKTDITTNIKANLESDSCIFYKKVFNLYRLERYAIIEELKRFFRPEIIVLFGSFAKGEDIEESDIDVLIISNVVDILDNVNLSKYEKLLNRKINLHILPSLEKSSNEFKNTIANGIVLHGYLKLL